MMTVASRCNVAVLEEDFDTTVRAVCEKIAGPHGAAIADLET